MLGDDPAAIEKVVKDVFPDATTRVVGDAVLVEYVDPVTGENQVGWVNKPGFSGADAKRLAAEAILFGVPGAGAIRLGRAGVGTARAIMLAGTAGGAEAGVEAGRQIAREEVTGESLSPADIALAGAFGAGAEGVGRMVGFIKKNWTNSRLITKSGREYQLS